MTSKSTLSYGDRAKTHPNPLVKKLFTIAENKSTNVVLSADVTTSKELLDLADRVGPYIAVLKTHIDIISDLTPSTTESLRHLAEQHRFLIFEDSKFVDIGNTVQMQYHGGALHIAEWAHIVNCSVLAGPSIVDALAKKASSDEVRRFGVRGLLILAEMTSKGNFAHGEYTTASVEIARDYPSFVVGFVALTSLAHVKTQSTPASGEDFVIFTTGVNRVSSSDPLGQQYKTPAKAVAGGADFIIAGRGIYAADDPVESAKCYQQEGWEAYLGRIQGENT